VFNHLAEGPEGIRLWLALDEGATLLTIAFDPDDRFHALFRRRAMNRIEYRLGVKALRPGVPAEAQRRVHRAPNDPRREEREEIPAIPARAQVDEEHGHGEETQHESADRRNDAHGAAQLSSQWGVPNRLLIATRGWGSRPSSVMTISDYVPQRQVAFNVVTTARNPPPSRKNRNGIRAMNESDISASESARPPLQGAMPAVTTPIAT